MFQDTSVNYWTYLDWLELGFRSEHATEFCTLSNSDEVQVWLKLRHKDWSTTVRFVFVVIFRTATKCPKSRSTGTYARRIFI